MFVPLFSSRFQALLAFMRVIRRTQRPLPNGIADLEKLGIQSRRRGAGVRTYPSIHNRIFRRV
jgi:hypothetical protein